MNPYLISRSNPARWLDPDGRYAEAGHYYTTFYVALKSGMNEAQAKQLAFLSQLPDEADEFDAIGVQAEAGLDSLLRASLPLAAINLPINRKNADRRDLIQPILHALNGGSGQEETEITLSAMYAARDDVVVTGLLIHRLGDTYAHRNVNNANTDADLYSKGLGQAADGRSPDVIQSHPDRYLAYAQKLAQFTGVRQGMDPKQVAAFESEVVKALTPVAGISKLTEEEQSHAASPWRISVRAWERYRTNDQLEASSIHMLKELISAQSGRIEGRPEDYPEAWPMANLLFPFFENDVGEAIEFGETRLNVFGIRSADLESATNRVATLLERSRSLVAKSKTISESSSIDGDLNESE